MRIFISSCVVVLALTPLCSLAAQTCLGNPSFASGAVRLTTLAAFADRQEGFGVEAAAGTPRSIFASAAIQRTSLDSAGVSLDTVHHSTTDYTFTIGYQISLGAARAQLCPMVAFDRTSGGIHNPLLAERVRSNRGTFGVAFGAVASHSETVDFVPAVAVAYNDLHARTRGDPTFGTLFDFSTHSDYWTVTCSPAFIFNRVVSLGPSVTIPFGERNLLRSYAIRIGFNFGHGS